MRNSILYRTVSTPLLLVVALGDHLTVADEALAAYEQALRDEFDQLYEEGMHRRRMMVRNVHAESPAPRRDCARSIAS